MRTEEEKEFEDRMLLPTALDNGARIVAHPLSSTAFCGDVIEVSRLDRGMTRLSRPNAMLANAATGEFRYSLWQEVSRLELMIVIVLLFDIFAIHSIVLDILNIRLMCVPERAAS